jgi:hypothetical protein
VEKLLTSVSFHSNHVNKNILTSSAYHPPNSIGHTILGTVNQQYSDAEEFCSICWPIV